MNMSLRNIAPRAALCVLLFSIPDRERVRGTVESTVTIVVPYGPGGGNNSLHEFLPMS